LENYLANLHVWKRKYRFGTIRFQDTYFIIKGVSEKLEDIKGIISSRKSQDRQHNAQRAKEQTAIYKTS
jgi:hypothetical protein